MKTLRCAILLGTSTLLACSGTSQTGTVPDSGADGSVQPTDGGGGVDGSANPDGGAGADSGVVVDAGCTGGGAGLAGNVVNGCESGKGFKPIVNAYVIGAPDSAATTVIYLVDAPLACAAIVPTWDTKLPVDTNILELKLGAHTTGSYTAITPDPNGNPPPPTQAYSNHANVQKPTPSENGATAGTVTLSQVRADKSVVGTFDLTFRFGDRLTGTFDAVYCATGTEP